jgi:hypothetical protein
VRGVRKERREWSPSAGVCGSAMRVVVRGSFVCSREYEERNTQNTEYKRFSALLPSAARVLLLHAVPCAHLRPESARRRARLFTASASNLRLKPSQGKTFHPECFKCKACSCALMGVQFFSTPAGDVQVYPSVPSCVCVCVWGGGGGGGVSCLSCSAALLIHASARLAVRRGRLCGAEPLCIRIYTCVYVCIRVYTHAYMCM